MVPTLIGRLQTRVASLGVIGSLLTLLVTPVLPMDGGLGAKYKATFGILVTVIVLGLAWELLYHWLQQWRWEKDWPTIFGLLTAIPEGILVWIALGAGLVPGDPSVSGLAFVVDFVVVWIGTWLFVNGPMRVPFLRWRFTGGRLI
jgi:hypothetical protein